MRVAAATALLLAFTATARADVPPPNSEGCSSKSAGDACKNDSGATATCKATTCSRLDYSQGTPPSSVSYDCLLCEGPAPTPATGTSTSSRCDASGRGDAAPSALAGGVALLGLWALRRRGVRAAS